MNIIDRWKTAYDSPFGSLLVLLLCIFGGLLLLYAVLRYRQRTTDFLAYKNHSYYEKAEQIAALCTFFAGHKRDFFGRVSKVFWGPKKVLGICCVPSPQIAEEATKVRFRTFLRALEGEPLPLFAPILWSHAKEVLVIVYGDLLKKEGTPLLSLSQYFNNSIANDKEKEEILLHLAKALAELHERRTESGDALYHGFLLPRSIHIERDAHHQMKRIVISDLGLAYALGPRKFLDLLEQVKQNKSLMEEDSRRELLEQIAMLAPEQKTSGRTSQVTNAVDFFAFGALAISLFTCKPFTTASDIAWQNVPEKWQPFLKACLQDKASHRPTNILEIEEWLNDPELALTLSASSDIAVDKSSEMPSESVEESLPELLQKFKSVHKKPESSLTLEFKQHFDSGLKAMKISKWADARKHLKNALKIDPSHPEANVQLAIVFFELGDAKNAEKHYEFVKREHPKSAKAFREYLAFKV